MMMLVLAGAVRHLRSLPSRAFFSLLRCTAGAAQFNCHEKDAIRVRPSFKKLCEFAPTLNIGFPFMEQLRAALPQLPDERRGFGGEVSGPGQG
jgi:hypothetical protein